jgi:Na+/H+ antiporter NhaC
MRIKSDYWKQRIGTLTIATLFILIGISAVLSKHVGKVNGIQYYGTDAIHIGIIFIAAGLICLFVGFRKTSDKSPK